MHVGVTHTTSTASCVESCVAGCGMSPHTGFFVGGHAEEGHEDTSVDAREQLAPS